MQSTDTERLHARLREVLVMARKAKKLTQIDLAEKLGETQAWVSRYETGPRKLDVAEFLIITHAIGVDPSALLRKVASAMDVLKRKSI